MFELVFIAKIVNKFEILLTTFDNMSIDQLQKGLIYYFSNNDFIKGYHANYLESNLILISDINAEIEVLGDMRVEGAKNNLDVSSVNIVSGQKVISNQIVVLSQLREDIKTKQALLKPLVFVQNFAKVNQKEDDILVWTILGGILSFIFGLFVALIREVKIK